VVSQSGELNGMEHSAVLNVPPLSALYYDYVPAEKTPLSAGKKGGEAAT
jgi:hypothetical protein